MAEQMILVCDVCGKPAERTVTFRFGRRSLARDLCGTHLQELVRTSHAPSRSRKPQAISSKRSSRAKPRGRTRRRTSPGSSAAKTARKRITDPATLEKRRAALAKARQALAKKRAAAKSSA